VHSRTERRNRMEGYEYQGQAYLSLLLYIRGQPNQPTLRKVLYCREDGMLNNGMATCRSQSR
jgi:hypothetical protein